MNRTNTLTVTLAALIAVSTPSIAQQFTPQDCSLGILAVPDRLNGRVLAFSQVDGSLITPTLIPGDARLVAPKDVVCTGYSIFVSDQPSGSVYEYAFTGEFIRTIVDGPATGLADIRGLDINNNRLYIAVGAGAFTDTVQTFNLDGSAQAAFATTNLSSPRSMVVRAADVLVTSAATNSIERFDFTGNWIGRWNAQPVFNPEQLALGFMDQVLVAGGSAASGIYTLNIDGEQDDRLLTGVPNFGVHQLLNGNVLFTTGTDVRVYDVGEKTYSIVAADGDYQYVKAILIPSPAAAALPLAFAITAAARRRRA